MLLLLAVGAWAGAISVVFFADRTHRLAAKLAWEAV
tara:strand:- start:153 stop:260 length:108 start_codon:yes stop_codon:yes gene_type:complete